MFKKVIISLIKGQENGTITVQQKIFSVQVSTFTNSRWQYSWHILNILANFILDILIEYILTKKACIVRLATSKQHLFFRI